MIYCDGRSIVSNDLKELKKFVSLLPGRVKKIQGDFLHYKIDGYNIKLVKEIFNRGAKRIPAREMIEVAKNCK